MDQNNLLNALFLINYKLKVDELDSFFKEHGFENNFSEDSILSYIKTTAPFTAFTVRLKDNEIANSDLKTSAKLNFAELIKVAQTKYGFKLKPEEIEKSSFSDNMDLIILAKDNLRIHLMKYIISPGLISYNINLFEKLIEGTVEVTIMPLSPL
jgi:hypothetical protein